MTDKVKHAIVIGTLCSISYFTVYIGRNILSAVTPQMILNAGYTTEYIGSVSSMFFAAYAVGQLINGFIGEKIKARYMMSVGLIMAGLCNLLFPVVIDYQLVATLLYGMMGFFLAMIYAPMTKLVAENTEPIYATRCSLGYESGALLGSPAAGIVAAMLSWYAAFYCSGIVLVFMGICCFIGILILEKKGIVKYNKYQASEKTSGNIKTLMERRIVKFTLIAAITGVVRTSVVFWMPTYISQYLGFDAEDSALIFTVATLFISLTAFISVFVYEKLHRNMDLTILISFMLAAGCFMGTYFINHFIGNVICLVLAIMSSNSAACMLWSRYCPSLYDTGMVSSATGFLDFINYMAAAAASALFANAVSQIGWGNLILVWFALMILGIVVSAPWKKH